LVVERAVQARDIEVYLHSSHFTKTFARRNAVAVEELGGGHGMFAGVDLSTFGQRGAGSEDPRTTEFDDFERSVAGGDGR
jgi:hypothetical protein